MSLTNFEKETIIIFNEAEPTARIETFNSRIIREAEKAAARSADVVREERRENKHGAYTMPKTYIKIRAASVAEKAANKIKLQKALEAKRQKAL